MDKKYIERESLFDIEEYKEVLKTEIHHDHKLVEIDGVIRWEEHLEKTAC